MTTEQESIEDCLRYMKSALNNQAWNTVEELQTMALFANDLAHFCMIRVRELQSDESGYVQLPELKPIPPIMMADELKRKLDGKP